MRNSAATAGSGHANRSRAACKSAPALGATGGFARTGSAVDIIVRLSTSLDLRSCSTVRPVPAN
jgi:hypothetical protein